MKFDNIDIMQNYIWFGEQDSYALLVMGSLECSHEDLLPDKDW